MDNELMLDLRIWIHTESDTINKASKATGSFDAAIDYRLEGQKVLLNTLNAFLDEYQGI